MLFFSQFLAVVFIIAPITTISEMEERETYIIHIDQSLKPNFSTHESWHRNILASVTSSTLQDSSGEEESFLYSYQHVMHGFSARLTPSELSKLEMLKAHRATYKEGFGKLFTTHTTSFLGLNYDSGIWPNASYGTDIIIGLLDTGVWPESKSFHDRGMPPVPKRWRGCCEGNETKFCNRKIIGARSFSKGFKAAGFNISKEWDYDSARDFMGHGTHTASTAAGNYALGAGHFGYATGTARGVAPRAHLALYKVVWAGIDYRDDQSVTSDVLAGMDQAVADGVDILSLSLAIDRTPYFQDVIAIASLTAIEKGVHVVCAAGNDGPGPNSTYNGAPWIMTVGASTVDRSFIGTLNLGDGSSTIEGVSYFPESIYITNAPLYYGKGNSSKEMCNFSALDPREVTGKVVLCDNRGEVDIVAQMSEVERAGALAGIFSTDKLLLEPGLFTAPRMFLQTEDCIVVKKYAINTMNAMVKEMRFVLTKLGTEPAPQVAFFSSRGPDPISPSVLKPDIISPGEDVLAAVTPNRPFLKVGSYKLATDYALFSGTSMAAPHAAGVAALLKAIHKDWSPAAVRSAIMTTATSVDNTHSTIRDKLTGLSATPLDFGAGHINPNKAMDPGLIYDLEFQDYVEFLCSLHYNKKQMRATIRQNHWSCHEKHHTDDLNYPSFIAIFPKSTSFPRVKNFSRVVTNVGDDNSVYQAVFEVPTIMRITAEPNILSFTGKGQKKRFILSVEIQGEAALSLTYGYLKWVDQHNHIVSSPVVAMT